MGTLAREAILLLFFLVSLSLWNYAKLKEFAPKKNFFLVEYTHFKTRCLCRKANTKSQKLFPIVKCRKIFIPHQMWKCVQNESTKAFIKKRQCTENKMSLPVLSGISQKAFGRNEKKKILKRSEVLIFVPSVFLSFLFFTYIPWYYSDWLSTPLFGPIISCQLFFNDEPFDHKKIHSQLLYYRSF